MDEQRLGLTVFLLNPNEVSKFREALPGAAEPSFTLAPPLEGFFLPMQSAVAEPAWLGAVRSILQTANTPPLVGQSPAGLLFIQRGAKSFVVSFGHAWRQLEDEWLEQDFGRRVALNSIPRDQILEIRAEQVFAKWHIADERAPRASSVDEFGVEFDRDLVAVVEGVPAEPLISILGKTVRGGTSLRVKIPFNTLPDVLDKAGTLFDSNAYKAVWPEIDNVTPVKEQSLIDKLESQLDAEFASGHAQQRLVMFIPTRRDEGASSMESYVFGRLSKLPSITPYLTVNSWLTYVQMAQKPLTVAEAKSTRIHLMDEYKEEIKAYNVFQCFGYELALGGQQYVLSSGIWYEVVANFLSRINSTANTIPNPKTKLVLWDPGENEGQYNLRCANERGFLFFDAQNVLFGGGQSKFEFCDFLDLKTKTLFFAKITSRSSGMSHLVEQVRRTAELLFSTDDGFRKELVRVFSKFHPSIDTAWLDSRPRNGTWLLCMVSLGKNASQLPFFARCGLVRVYKELAERGHAVAFTAV
ncbi:MAG TPA: TIGR04141 family sporadically distributed protein [Candidatus Angelobacter sp.]|nr:TIGR04141 family sporadically distributed protein [Candidatus Angelobacter sp.]